MCMSYCTSVPGGRGSGGLAAGMTGCLVSIGGIHSKKETLQCLNNHHLATYLEGVRSLEADNQRQESEIQKHMGKKELQVRYWGNYFKTVEDLRAQIFARSLNNAYIVLQIDSSHLADGFRLKSEIELAMCQSVQSDISGL